MFNRTIENTFLKKANSLEPIEASYDSALQADQIQQPVQQSVNPAQQYQYYNQEEHEKMYKPGERLRESVLKKLQRQKKK